jgi:branched-chain amino acid transport system substrate-binding protein
MVITTRRSVVGGLAASALAAPMIGPAGAQARPVRIGYIVSRTGLNAPGAGTTTIPNYELWAADVKAAGGLALPGGQRAPLEIVAYDDRSQTEEVVRGISRLATQDRVDFILPPWGTGFNMAVAPLMDRFGYPQLVGTSLIPHGVDITRWKRSFWFLGHASDYMGAMADMLGQQASSGTINKKVALISVADGFGIELVAEARRLFAAGGLEIVLDKSYPVATQDFATLIGEAAASGADAFLALSYPSDTFAINKQARLSSFNPKVFYTGVGTSFPVFRRINENKTEGVLSLGGIDSSRPEMQAYVERHRAFVGNPPDFWASSIIYTSLQVLEQAIARRGVNRDAVVEEMAKGSFDTIIGQVQLSGNRLTDLWLLGQWQGDTFVGVRPANRAGAKRIVVPKPAWQ